MNAILQDKIKLNSSTIKENITLSGHTTFGVGGSADYFCIAQTKEDLISMLKWCRNFNLPFLIIGNGSNLLVAESGFRGLVIKLGSAFKKINHTNNLITASAGVSLPILLQEAKTHSLGGLEPLAGIPGTVGGAVVTNAGTHYGKIGDIISKLELMDLQGVNRILDKKDLKFFYRGSNINSKSGIIIEAEFSLSAKDKNEIDKDMTRYLEERKKRQPWDMKSAGCIFKNPPQGPAAKFIEEAGLKGFSKGDAMVSELHANFIVNKGQANSNDILYLIRTIQDKVYKKFGISLELEIIIV